ncbi:MAG: tetratricopeptide repeat protein [Myxococcales bacterium]|nr:tetratricopeptide repeat protein [Myxococcales bacterium]MCB9553716.1 tetratricopeptide repeat protein [Myxococcales bacterium]
MIRALAAIAALSAAGLSTGCGGARQEALEESVAEMRRELRGLREAYETQNRRLEAISDRLALAEDHLEARALHPLPDRLPVVRLTPSADRAAPAARAPAAYTPAAPAPAAALDADRYAADDTDAAADTDDGEPLIIPGEQPPATITQADIDRLDGGAGAMTPEDDDTAPRPRRRARRPVPPPANAAFAGNIGTRPLAAQPDFDAAAQGPIAAYRAAEARYRAGDLTAAIQGFDAVVATWPEHGFADNALYLVGRCRYDRAEYAAALTTFRAVLTRYPTGNQVPDALLMIGLTQEKLGRAAEGRETLARLRAIYPDTAAAREAQARLDRTPGRM